MSNKGVYSFIFTTNPEVIFLFLLKRKEIRRAFFLIKYFMDRVLLWSESKSIMHFIYSMQRVWKVQLNA